MHGGDNSRGCDGEGEGLKDHSEFNVQDSIGEALDRKQFKNQLSKFNNYSVGQEIIKNSISKIDSNVIEVNCTNRVRFLLKILPERLISHIEYSMLNLEYCMILLLHLQRPVDEPDQLVERQPAVLKCPEIELVKGGKGAEGGKA